MGRQEKIKGSRKPITWQAGMRLLLSLGLFVAVVSMTSVLIYRAALNNAAQERVEDLEVFYQSRMQQLEHDWELQTRDFRTRIEFTRYLEHPQSAVINLRAFFTIQGGERRFSRMLIRDRAGNILFQLGKDRSPALPDADAVKNGWYLDVQSGKLFRIFSENIWLGRQGAGTMLTYYPIDNALLYQLAVPGTALTAFYLDEYMADSAGSVGRNGMQDGLGEVQRKRLKWMNDGGSPLQFEIRVPVKGIFSAQEVSAGVGLIPVIDALILWFVLGTWLMLQARRIRALDMAVLEFSRRQGSTPELEASIAQARSNGNDEIDDVAVAVESLVMLTVEQRQERQRYEHELLQHRDRLEAMVAERTAELESANRKLLQQSKQLMASESDLRQAQAVAKIGSWTLDMRLARLQWSDETYRIFGIEPGTPVTYERFLEAVHEEDADRVDASWRAALTGAPYRIDHRIRVGDEVKWVREQAELVFDAQGKVESGIGTVQDITELKNYEQKIELMAYFDSLTGLPNRRMLFDRLNHLMASGKRSGLYSALMFIDLDNFKPLNDKYGHAAGDQLLVEVAQRLSHCVRETDTVARFGGDEFVLLLCDLDRDAAIAKEEAAATAAKIRASLGQEFQLQADERQPGIKHMCTPSIGINLFCGNVLALEEIIRRADAAMYQSKLGGRNRITFAAATAA